MLCDSTYTELKTKLTHMEVKVRRARMDEKLGKDRRLSWTLENVLLPDGCAGWLGEFTLWTSQTSVYCWCTFPASMFYFQEVYVRWPYLYLQDFLHCLWLLRLLINKIPFLQAYSSNTRDGHLVQAAFYGIICNSKTRTKQKLKATLVPFD